MNCRRKVYTVDAAYWLSVCLTVCHALKLAVMAEQIDLAI